jgi:hypothetical protein
MINMAQNPFSEEEQGILFEAARIALADAETFDNLAIEMDLSDEMMRQVCDHLQQYQDGEV